MPAQLATLICILVILYLFWMDRKKIEGVSNAIWIPFFWMVLAGSRLVSLWLSSGPQELSEDAYLDGNPLNRAIFLALMLGGIIILIKRGLNWSELFKRNVWVGLFFIFGAVSIFWSEFPFVAFKRLFKALGNVVMVLIILTEERPYMALGAILRRFAFLLLPLSILFIKYYPDLGRAYHMGKPMFAGVAGHKNQLGNICLLSGIYFSWNLLFNRLVEMKQERKLPISIYFILFTMIVWLFYKANSATSMACMIVALALFIVARQPSVASSPRKVMAIFVGCIFLAGLMELAFGLKDSVIALLGRRQDLTTRVPMWEDLLAMVKDPLLGFGYESFWLGDRRTILQDRWGDLIQAHNGYIQMYLDLGYVGLFFIVAWILSGLNKVARCLLVDYPTAVLRLCFIVIVSLYNYTEAIFFGVSNMWIIFLLGIMDIPTTALRPVQSASK